MPVEVADTALDLVAEDVRTTGRPAHVQLAGGEPTLVPSLIEHVAKRVVEIRWEKVTCGIQTNAARLDGDIIAMLKRHSVRVGVSVDGPPPVHEKTRGSAARAAVASERAGTAANRPSVARRVSIETGLRENGQDDAANLAP